MDEEFILVGGQQHQLHPLTIGAIGRHKQTLRVLAEGGTTDPHELFDRMAGVVHDAITRKGAQLTREQLDDAVDWTTLLAAFNCVMRLSFPAPASGETPAGSPSGASTGTS